ncbi:MAG: hypothetical protein K2X77_27125 [Candidatus Obscuribacterales bacterium]|nr:hypothetical protein [Candidatus Obscuribacterales bacterium]
MSDSLLAFGSIRASFNLSCHEFLTTGSYIHFTAVKSFHWLITIADYLFGSSLAGADCLLGNNDESN